jgi:hypothetical protein
MEDKREMNYSVGDVFSNAFFVIFHHHTGLDVIYYRYKFIVAKLMTLQISHCIVSEMFAVFS